MHRLHKRLADLERPIDTPEGIESKVYLLCFSDWEEEDPEAEIPGYAELLELSFQYRKQTKETSAATIKEYEAELIRSLPETGSELLLTVINRIRPNAEN